MKNFFTAFILICFSTLFSDPLLTGCIEEFEKVYGPPKEVVEKEGEVLYIWETHELNMQVNHQLSGSDRGMIIAWKNIGNKDEAEKVCRKVAMFLSEEQLNKISFYPYVFGKNVRLKSTDGTIKLGYGFDDFGEGDIAFMMLIIKSKGA